MTWYLYAILVGLVLPWIIVTYRILGAFRRGVGAGVLTWLKFSAISVPIMLAIMWGLERTK
ncbi:MULTISPECIES: hypothetical protein [Rhodopseudomonas]|uniref:MFS transporter n=1 Tax=Rhodopseudomonas palustris TaxID=1076 RepID=A0A0D7EH56_RHOPL|nr:MULTISPECIES: hypothetical protein [Rhodopseudomonas]KIZ40164.1 MFS transporter [Rhodopseudomonas palustris]MDF3813015.1 hypothetical protein [Rhodopseudomonas sp. BAL398]WOK20218.1 hypothetical protein RBJ75_12170 [Rhodopseudomonas sp. BAL398]